MSVYFWNIRNLCRFYEGNRCFSTMCSCWDSQQCVSSQYNVSTQLGVLRVLKGDQDVLTSVSGTVKSGCFVVILFQCRMSRVWGCWVGRQTVCGWCGVAGCKWWCANWCLGCIVGMRSGARVEVDPPLAAAVETTRTTMALLAWKSMESLNLPGPRWELLFFSYNFN